MFLKSLTIARANGSVLRDIQFHKGMNLIVDETPAAGGKETGNSVGKTTVLKLVDFCLGASAKGIYTDTEHRSNEYKLVKDFLVNQGVIATLILKEDLDDPDAREVRIERNFLTHKARIQRVDGQTTTDEEFERALTDILFPGHYGKKPTFRQIIGHNIRYQDQSINNTLKHLDRYTRDEEYETLFLFLFGCGFSDGDARQEVISKLQIEERFKKRLESEQSRAGYETALAILEGEIEILQRQKSNFNINPDFERQLEDLNRVKYEINVAASEIARLDLRRGLIVEAGQEIKSGVSKIDVQQLKRIYEQATSITKGIQKSFEDLCTFHNNMVAAKARFVTQELPQLEADLSSRRKHLDELRGQERFLNAAMTQSDAFGTLEKIIADLNSKHQLKGDYEGTLRQLIVVDTAISGLKQRLSNIDKSLFSDAFLLSVKDQVNKFNRFFSLVSHELYGEQYAVKVEKAEKKGRTVYVFTSFNTNFSSGKKQGEISCFDIAYTLFADAEEIPCMRFLLNDKKELMHGNQLSRIADYVNSRNIQYVASILKDKLPSELNDERFIVLKLSQGDKLFSIENGATTSVGSNGS